MPIYEGDQYTYEQLSDLRKRNVCAECGGRLDLYQNFDNHKAFIACADWMRTHHEGIMRERSRYEKEGLASLNIKTRSEIMEQEHGSGMTTAMERARLPMTGALTQPQAMHILKLAYPKAPEDQIIRTAIFCRDFGLHPLAKEVFLIPYGDTWVMTVGIPANRKMAHNLKGEFTFLDDTPRAASDTEIIKQFGKNSEETIDNIISVTKLKGEGGNLAIGFGLYPRNEKPKGMEKGNTRRNMANIRSERQAMDRLPGPSMPKVEVVDERYFDVPDVGKVIVATGEIVEGEAIEVEPEPEIFHYCTEHDCAYELKTGRFGEFYAHKVEGGWCNEVKPKNKKAKATKESKAPEPTPEPATGTLQDLQETMALCNWTYADVGKYCNTERGWGINSLSDLKPDQLAKVIAHIKVNAR